MIRLQKGAALAISLLLLLIITLIGVSAMQVTRMEEKMSSNLQDKLLSFSAAESGLRAGEQWLLAQLVQPEVYTTCPSFPCVHEPYSITSIDLSTESSSWWQSNSALFSGSLTDVATAPRYIVEFIQFVPDSPVVGNSAVKSTGVYFYQITSRATGASNDAVTILQSNVARRF